MRVFEAVLAALADHGFTPDRDRHPADLAVRARLGAGRAGRRAARRRLALPRRHRGLRPVPARRARGARRAAHRRGRLGRARARRRTPPARGRRASCPGSATTCTRTATRARRGCFEIAREEGLFGPHLALFEAIGRVHPEVLGKTLPLNGAGVCGAALADLGLPLELLRGFALLARTAGLIGQLAEELRHPVANDIFLSVDLNNRPVDPDPLPAPRSPASQAMDRRSADAAGHRGQHHRARRSSAGAPPTTTRTRELLTGLVQHLHDFAREVRLTEAEWMAAIQWLKRTGQISDEKREEFILASDVLGLSMLVVQMNHRFDAAATPATVLGPFHIDGSPELDYAADMSEGLPGVPLYVSGTVRSLDGYADRRGGARRVAGRRGRRLRGPAPGRGGPAAREVHRPRGRHLLRPDHRAQGLLDPDGRPGRRADRADRHQPLPPGARALPAQRARLPAADHAPVRGGCASTSTATSSSAPSRSWSSATSTTSPGRRRTAAPATVPWASATYDFVLQPT